MYRVTGTDWAGLHSGKALGSCWGGAWFEYELRQCISRFRVYTISSFPPDTCRESVSISPTPLLPDPFQFIHHLSIQRCRLIGLLVEASLKNPQKNTRIVVHKLTE
jgi:hypothetical protein